MVPKWVKALTENIVPQVNAMVRRKKNIILTGGWEIFSLLAQLPANGRSVVKMRLSLSGDPLFHDIGHLIKAILFCVQSCILISCGRLVEVDSVR